MHYRIFLHNLFNFRLFKKQILKKLSEDMPEIQDVDKAISILKREKEEEALQFVSIIILSL